MMFTLKIVFGLARGWEPGLRSSCKTQKLNHVYAWELNPAFSENMKFIFLLLILNAVE